MFVIFLEVLKHITNQNYLFELISFLIFFIQENLFLHLHFDVFLKIIEFVFIKLVKLSCEEDNIRVILRLLDLVHFFLRQVILSFQKINANCHKNLMSFCIKVYTILIPRFFINLEKNEEINKNNKTFENEKKFIAKTLQILKEILQLYLVCKKSVFRLKTGRLVEDLMLILGYDDIDVSQKVFELIFEVVSQNAKLLINEDIQFLPLKRLLNCLITCSPENAMNFITKINQKDIHKIFFLTPENASKCCLLNLEKIRNILLDKSLGFEKSILNKKIEKCVIFSGLSQKSKLERIFTKILLLVDYPKSEQEVDFLFRIMETTGSLLNELAVMAFEKLISTKHEFDVLVIRHFKLLITKETFSISFFCKPNSIYQLINFSKKTNKGLIFWNSSFDLRFVIYKLIIKNYHQFLLPKMIIILEKNNEKINNQTFQQKQKIFSKDTLNLSQNPQNYKPGSTKTIKTHLSDIFILFNISEETTNEFMNESKNWQKNTTSKNFPNFLLKIIDLLKVQKCHFKINPKISTNVLDFVAFGLTDNLPLVSSFFKAVLINPRIFDCIQNQAISEKIARYLFEFRREDIDFENIKFKNEDVKLKHEIESLLFEVQVLFINSLLRSDSAILRTKLIADFLEELPDSFCGFLNSRCSVLFMKENSEKTMTFSRNDQLELLFENYRTVNEFNARAELGLIIRAFG